MEQSEHTTQCNGLIGDDEIKVDPDILAVETKVFDDFCDDEGDGNGDSGFAIFDDLNSIV